MISKKTQPKKRKDKIDLLTSYLDNPGRFSILILGNRGTGKKFWIKEKYKELEDFNIIQINAALTESSNEFWTKQFALAHKGILIIEDTELLTKETQAVLFDGLGTHNGKYGFESKEFEVNIIFTSSKTISALRNTERYLSDKFFDRIAQLIVAFPNFQQCANKITQDFKNTWNKFKFKTTYPDLLIPWLNENAHKLHGNFRDLDKLCIIWNNFQLLGKTEEEILKEIKANFLSTHGFPEVKKESVHQLHFSRDITYQDLVDDFKRQLKVWVKAEFSSLRDAGESLGVSHRTIERW